MEKDPKFYRAAPKPPNVATADSVEHVRLRRLLANGFSDKAIRDQEPIIQQYVDLMIRQLHRSCEGGREALDMTAWYNWATFDLIGDLTFGESFGCLENRAYNPWISMIFSFMKVGTLFQVFAHYPTIKRLLLAMIPPSLMAKRIAHQRLTKEKVSKRIEMKNDRPDFYESILKRKDELVGYEI